MIFASDMYKRTKDTLQGRNAEYESALEGTYADLVRRLSGHIVDAGENGLFTAGVNFLHHANHLLDSRMVLNIIILMSAGENE